LSLPNKDDTAYRSFRALASGPLFETHLRRPFRAHTSQGMACKDA
jgi:hypothetical protein